MSRPTIPNEDCETQDETFVQPELEGKIKVDAKILELEQVKGQVLNYLDHLEYDPAQVEVVYGLLEELHHREEESISAPGPALVAAVAIAVSIGTSGVGGAIVGQAATLAGTMSSTAISSLTAQVATQVTLGILAQQSPADILAQITRPETLKNMVTSALTAGALHELQEAQAVAETPDFLRRVENAGAQATIGMGANLALGEQNLGDALGSAGVQFVSQTASGFVANRIGNHFANENDPLSRGAHKVAHGVSAAAFAGAGAAALGQNVEAAATGAAAGAMISEIVAESLARPLQEDVIGEMRRQQAELGRPLTVDEGERIWNSRRADISKIARLTGALSGLFAGNSQGVSSANGAAETAIENNFLLTMVPAWAMVGPALMEAASVTGFIGSAAIVGGILNEATNSEPATAGAEDSAREKSKGNYENPGHHDPSGGPNPYDPSKSVLPKNHKELWDKSVKTDDRTRWTKVGDGKKSEFHRFKSDGNGNWHWNGSTSGVTNSGRSRPIRPNDVPKNIRNLPGS